MGDSIAVQSHARPYDSREEPPSFCLPCEFEEQRLDVPDRELAVAIVVLTFEVERHICALVGAEVYRRSTPILAVALYSTGPLTGSEPSFVIFAETWRG